MYIIFVFVAVALTSCTLVPYEYRESSDRTQGKESVAGIKDVFNPPTPSGTTRFNKSTGKFESNPNFRQFEENTHSYKKIPGKSKP